MIEHDPAPAKSRPTLEYSSPRRAGRKAGGWLIFLVSAALVLVLVTLMLPNLSTPRHGPEHGRIRCAGNLRHIGQAMVIYSNKSGGTFPPSLEVLVMNGDLAPSDLVCDGSNDVSAPGTQPSDWAVALRTPGYASYVYAIGAVPESSVTPRHVLAYERTGHTHDKDGMNVLFGDSQVKWVPRRDAEHLISELNAGHNPPRPR